MFCSTAWVLPKFLRLLWQPGFESIQNEIDWEDRIFWGRNPSWYWGGQVVYGLLAWCYELPIEQAHSIRSWAGTISDGLSWFKPKKRLKLKIHESMKTFISQEKYDELCPYTIKCWRRYVWLTGEVWWGWHFNYFGCLRRAPCTVEKSESDL